MLWNVSDMLVYMRPSQATIKYECAQVILCIIVCMKNTSQPLCQQILEKMLRAFTIKHKIKQ